MPLGQSAALRFGASAVMQTLGVPPDVANSATAALGWLVAHFTLDHHSQLAYEAMRAAGTEDKALQILQAIAGYMMQGYNLAEAISLALGDGG